MNNLSNLNGILRPGIIHRIDKETSGLFWWLQKITLLWNLGKQFSDHTIKENINVLYKFNKTS